MQRRRDCEPPDRYAVAAQRAGHTLYSAPVGAALAVPIGRSRRVDRPTDAGLAHVGRVEGMVTLPSPDPTEDAWSHVALLLEAIDFAHGEGATWPARYALRIPAIERALSARLQSKASSDAA